MRVPGDAANPPGFSQAEVVIGDLLAWAEHDRVAADAALLRVRAPEAGESSLAQQSVTVGGKPLGASLPVSR